MTVLAVFKSRSETLAFLSDLRSGGTPASAMATPKEAGVGCGLSARFEEVFLPRAKYALTRRNYRSFAGFMKRSNFGYGYI